MAGKSIRDILKDKLTEEELKYLRRSFDIIGDIAVLEIPPELEHKEKIIAEAVMQIHKNVKVVVKKVGITEGEFRVRPVAVILGENRTETIHKENKCLFKVDIAKCFYTPRLATERMRIARKVKPGEVVADLFAGVGPYSILIAKVANPKVVYAIDKNPWAYKYLVENIKLNKVEGKVIPFLGDCREVVEKEGLIDIADRVIMNLPKYAGDFLDVGFKCAKNGGVIHFYYFLHESELFDGAIKVIEQRAKEYGVDFDVLECRKVGEIGPRQYRVCIDIKVYK